MQSLQNSPQFPQSLSEQVAHFADGGAILPQVPHRGSSSSAVRGAFADKQNSSPQTSSASLDEHNCANRLTPFETFILGCIGFPSGPRGGGWTADPEGPHDPASIPELRNLEFGSCDKSCFELDCELLDAGFSDFSDRLSSGSSGLPKG